MDEKIYVAFHMASMDYDGWDCKKFFGMTIEGRLDGICSKIG
jgi:hypothetical protein